MRAVVHDAWERMTERFEGRLTYLYADKYNWITTGEGNLVDPVSTAMGLPFLHPDGRAARGDEIAAAWWRVKNDPNCARYGHRYAAQLTTIRLTEEGVSRLVFAKLAQNNAELVARFPDFEEWPAAAQMALHSWAWACGAHANFPQLVAALLERDFHAAAVHIHIDESGPDHKLGTPDDNFGLHIRNTSNGILMRNAGRIDAFKLDPDMLDWEHELDVKALPTTPDLPDPPSDEPVLEDDGGTSRRVATLDAATEILRDLAQRRDDE